MPRSAQDDGLVTCPVDGCGRAFSRQDLRFIAGPGVLNLLDDHVMQLLTWNVICPLLGRCMNCKDTSLIPAHKLNPQVLKSTLASNGLDSVNPATCTVPVGPFDAQPLMCSKCFLVLCSKCGAQRESLAEASHQCNPLQKKCFDIGSSIMKLCSAYVHATQCYDRKTKSKISCFSCLPVVNKWRQNMQRHSPKKAELGPSLMDSELMLKSTMNGYNEAGFDERVQGTASVTSGSEEGSQATSVSSLRKMTRRAYHSRIDKQARAALQHLTSSILDMQQVDHRDVSPFIVALLCSHSLPYTLLKWLVKNDSVVHITEHSALYRDLLSFLRALSSTWDLLPLLCNPQLKYDSWVVKSRWETPGSVMSDFEKLFKQAQFMLRRNEHLGANELARPGITTLVADIKSTYELLCNRIKVWEEKTLQHEWSMDTSKSFGKQMACVLKREEARLVPDKEQQLLFNQLKSLIHEDDASNMASPGSSSTTHSTGTSDADQDSHYCRSDAALLAPPSAVLVEAYKRALRPLQFDEGGLLQSHYFRKDVESRKSFALNKRRSLAISNEMMELNTGLPLEWESSIFLRMDEQQTDVLRALIIGPEGTPYENGIFLFDLLLNEHYPDMPPKVHFLTTSAGKVRFNPNLYANGTVCLSILGTWNGPGWKAGESSIMQVLVSIQALVMVADPYYNEPFFHILGNRNAADTYILEQRYNTVAHSLVPALRSPDPLFKPVIHAHFRFKAPHILRQCNSWIEEETRADIKDQLKSCLREIRSELQKLTDVSLE